MNCPNCGQKMEREDYYFSRSISAGRRKPEESKAPQAEYECPECGACYFWERGQPLRTVWNPRDEAVTREEIQATMPDAPPYFPDNLTGEYPYGIRFPSDYDALPKRTWLQDSRAKRSKGPRS